MSMNRRWTRETVEAAFQQAQPDPSAVLLNSFGRKVFQVDGRIIKFGEPVDIQEAKASSFIAKSDLDIPIPTVYFAELCDGTTIIEMEMNQMIPGDTLEKVWPTLSAEEKRSYGQQLRAIVDQLRSLQGDYIGSFEQGPAVDARRDIHRGGPFFNETDFVEFLLSNTISTSPKIYGKMLRERLSTSHRIVLTHGDLSQKNILVREGRIVGLIDWEFAGWYPEYWEFVQFFRAGFSEYREYADMIFDRLYSDELMADHFLSHLTRH